MSATGDLRLHVRQVVNEVKNRLSTSKDPQELCHQLQRLRCLLLGHSQVAKESISNSPSGLVLIDSDTTQPGSKTNSPGLVSDITGLTGDSTRLKLETTKLADASTKLQQNKTGLRTSSCDFGDGELSKAQVEFCNHHYVRFLECLVDLLSLDWCGRFELQQRKDYLDVFFLKGVPQDAFLVLSSAIIHSR